MHADDYLSLNFVPEERALKLGGPQSTLFELGRLDVDAVGEAMTQEIVVTNGDTFRPRFGLPRPPPRKQHHKSDAGAPKAAAAPPSAPPPAATQAPEPAAPAAAMQAEGGQTQAATRAPAGADPAFYEVSLTGDAVPAQH